MSVPINLSTLPTEFRGCVWNDGWEFDVPCVVYFPANYAAFGCGGNTGGIDNIVEKICTDLSLGYTHNDGGLVTECEWRGWSKKGFARRRNAKHIIIKGHWEMRSGKPNWTQDSREETDGPPKVQKHK
jgi:hypothetical protein